MQTRTPPRRTVLAAIGFALLCIGLSIAAYASFGGSVPLAPQGYRFRLLVPDAFNLVQGSEVDVSGVKVGEVNDVVRVGNRASITATLQPQYAPLRVGTSAMVRTKTLLGETYLALSPGPREARAIPDGAELAASGVRASVSIDDLLSAFNPHAQAELRSLFTGLASSLAGRGAALSNSLAYASPLARNLNDVFRTLDAQTPDLQKLFAGSGTVLAALGRRQGDLRAVATAGNRALRATAEQNHALAGTVRALPSLLRRLRTAADMITVTSPDLDGAARALVPVARLLPGVLHGINDYLPAFRTLFNQLPATAAAGRRGLPSLTRILTAAPTGLSQLYPTLRQLIPTVQLFATYHEESLVGVFANAASMFNGTFVGPSGKIAHRVNGTIFVSNETLNGWVKRLPTNRANPYPTPTGDTLLGTQGYLDSYDCRNIHNPLYLPPIGTGVPPCTTQGPWSYDGGKPAYYPRLQPSPP